MSLLDVQPTPMWTDIVQAIGIFLGVPVTLVGIFQLFKKDKDKERKISSLEQLAQTQNQVVNKMQEQVEQLSIQSGQFQYQSSLMYEQNKLLEKQIDLQTTIFLHEQGIENQKLQIEKQKRQLEIRPYFTLRSRGSSSDNFFFIILNKGGLAKKLKLTLVDADFVEIRPIPENTNKENNESIEVKGHVRLDKTYLSNNEVPFSLNLEYEDVDGNKYIQTIQRPIRESYMISDPVLQIN